MISDLFKHLGQIFANFGIAKFNIIVLILTENKTNSRW